MLKICLTYAALQLAMPQFAWSQTVFFKQLDGAVMERVVTQSGSVDHRIEGIDGNGTSARFSGDFSSLTFQQSSSAASVLAMEVSVSETSSLSVDMASAGELLAIVVAGQYFSTITTTDADEKNLFIDVYAPDSAVSQDITLSGGAIDLRVVQYNSANLRLDYESLGGTAAVVHVTQGGFDTLADLTGSGNSGSILTLDMWGDTTSAYLNTSLGVNSRLGYVMNRDGASVGTVTTPISVTVPDNQTVTVTFN